MITNHIDGQCFLLAIGELSHEGMFEFEPLNDEPADYTITSAALLELADNPDEEDEEITGYEGGGTGRDEWYDDSSYDDDEDDYDDYYPDDEEPTHDPDFGYPLCPTCGLTLDEHGFCEQCEPLDSAFNSQGDE